MLLAMILGCSPLPTESSDLYGIWGRSSDGQAVVFEFWSQREYALYSYPLDEGPAVLSTGDYAIQNERLVMAADNGEEFDYALLDWAPEDLLELRVDGTAQTYLWYESLP